MSKEYRKMTRNAKGKVREVRDGQITIYIPLPIAEVVLGTSRTIEETAREVGLLLMSVVMDSEAEQLAGPKHSKNPDRTASWWAPTGSSLAA